MTVPPHTVTTQAGVTPGAQRRGKRRSWVRRLIYLAVVLIVVAVVGLGGVGWYYSSQLLDVAPQHLNYSQRILALHGNVVDLARTGGAMRSEVDGLVWPGGRAVIGPIISWGRRSVVRPILGSTHGLRVGIRVALDDHVYASPAALRIRYRTIDIPDSLGPMPAWYIGGSRATWVLMVHGYTSNRTEGLRALPTLVHAGLPTLLLSYRNDVGAPASPDHLYHLGATEWQDVEAGVRYALAHGAHSVILYGFSMGGNAVEEFLHHSRYAARVRGVVLDAPVLDWSPVLDLAAAKRHLPGLLTAVGKLVIAFRLGMPSLDSLNQVKPAADLKAPTLIFHGTGDTTVPISTSEALARARPDIVTLVRVPGADHTESWNVEPQRYAARLRSFLQHLLG